MPRLHSPAELEGLRREVQARHEPGAPRVSVCAGTGCLASGAADVVAAFRAEIERRGLSAAIDFRGTGCHGFCEKGPIVVIDPGEICYLQVSTDDVAEIVERTIDGGEVIERLLYADPTTGERTTAESDIPFYKHQERMVFGPNRTIDPKSIEDYLAIGGYRALAKALYEMTPEEVIAEVTEAGLRGRGGAGFPTGVKWGFARRAAGDSKVVVVNCDRAIPAPTWTAR